MLESLVDFIRDHDGINDKNKLASLVSCKFSCVKDRSVYYTEQFAIRFSKAKSQNLSNTILSLSNLKKYDNLPVLLCVVTVDKNYLSLCNTSFLSKISHSSKGLRTDNIVGSFNGSDIIRRIDTIQNIPENFDILFSIHGNHTFSENLERLVEATNNIAPTGKRFSPSGDEELYILESPKRAVLFTESNNYNDLLEDLDCRVKRFQNEILVAALIQDVKTRGNVIEYLIAGDDIAMRNAIVDALFDESPLPSPVLKDGLGDYAKEFQNFKTETDIKTKIMVLSSAPKGYNIDKFLSFLSTEKSVFMLYLVGIHYENKSITTRLVSIFQGKLLSNTVIQDHWAGRNSRGVTQFNGNAIKEIILSDDNTIDLELSKEFLEKLLGI